MLTVSPSNIYKASSAFHPGVTLVAKVSNKHAKRASTNYFGAVDVLTNCSHPNIIKCASSLAPLLAFSHVAFSQND